MQIYQMSVEDRAKIGANGLRYFESYFDHDVLVDELVNHMNSIASLKGTVS